MIPKIIHYCWFGGNPMSELGRKCIESWNKYLPEYVIKEWNENNFDLNENIYAKEAYEAKKWAFITDYVRLKVLYEYGGIYMDTDVEVCKNLDMFLTEYAFSGFESENFVPTGIMAAEKKHPFIGVWLEYYNNRHFKLSDGRYDQKTNTVTITNICVENGLILNNSKQTICGMTFYSNDFFCPKNHDTREVLITNNTACIHHFDGSWHTESEKKYLEVRRNCINKFGKSGIVIFKIYKYLFHPKEIFKRVWYGRE